MQKEVFLSCPHGECYPRCDNCHKKRRTLACELATHGHRGDNRVDIINDYIPKDIMKSLTDKGFINAVRF